MYLEFVLPSGAGGMAAQFVNQLLNVELHKWSDKYNIAYNKKIVKTKVKVTFDDPENYSFFALTWSPQGKQFVSHLINYRLVEPMSPPKSN